MTDVLFVCTGNIFRSLTAEYALRHALRQGGRTPNAITVASAGTEDYPHRVKPVVSDYLLRRGIDVGAHERRTLTRAMIDGTRLVVALSTEHCISIRKHFDREVPLFTQACGLLAEPLPDVEEVVPDHRHNPAAVAVHVHAIIDRILELTPRLADRLAEQLAARNGEKARHG